MEKLYSIQTSDKVEEMGTGVKWDQALFIYDPFLPAFSYMLATFIVLSQFCVKL